MKKWVALSFMLIMIFQNSFAQEEEDNSWDDYIYYLADTLAFSLRNNDTTLFAHFFDEDLLLEKYLVQKDDEFIKSFNDSYSKTLKKELNIAKDIINGIDGGYYDFLNYYTSIEGDAHIIYRLLGEEGGINYHDFELKWIEADSVLRIVDIYFYGNGQRVSEMLGDIYKDLLRGKINTKFGDAKVNEMEQALLQFKEVKTSMAAEQYKTAYVKFMEIPEKFRQDRLFRFWKIKVAEHLDNEKYIEAVDEFNQSFPKDPSFYILAMDKAILENKTEEAIKYINKIDISVGLDPFLDYYRGVAFFQTEKYDLAKKKLELVNQNFGFQKTNDMLFVIYLKEDQKELAIEILNNYLTDYNFTKEDIVNWLKEEHPEFLKTPEYLSWEKTH